MHVKLSPRYSASGWTRRPSKPESSAQFICGFLAKLFTDLITSKNRSARYTQCQKLNPPNWPYLVLRHSPPLWCDAPLILPLLLTVTIPKWVRVVESKEAIVYVGFGHCHRRIKSNHCVVSSAGLATININRLSTLRDIRPHTFGRNDDISSRCSSDICTMCPAGCPANTLVCSCPGRILPCLTQTTVRFSRRCEDSGRKQKRCTHT